MLFRSLQVGRSIAPQVLAELGDQVAQARACGKAAEREEGVRGSPDYETLVRDRAAEGAAYAACCAGFRKKKIKCWNPAGGEKFV